MFFHFSVKSRITGRADPCEKTNEAGQVSIWHALSRGSGGGGGGGVGTDSKQAGEVWQDET